MIPKKIHLSWNDKNILDSEFDLIKLGAQRLRSLNSNWEFSVHTDEEIIDYLRENMGVDFRLVENFHIVPKTDIWRLYKMYYEGGIYVDLDRLANVHLDTVISDNVKQVLPTCRHYDFSHDIMISEPGNILFANTIDLYLFRRKQGHHGVYFLGPQTYMHSVTYTFTQKIINTNPGEDVFLDLLDKLKSFSGLLIYEENPPYNTFIYRGKEIIEDHETMKRNFYKENGLKHWTGEW
jgi:mannosyltransferase OCH1-like enzyme